MTSEQSIRLFMSCPSVAMAVKMNWKSEVSFVWLSRAIELYKHVVSWFSSGWEKYNEEYALTKDCHSQEVRESRASRKSDCRRSSPGRGDSTSPWFPAVLQRYRQRYFEMD